MRFQLICAAGFLAIISTSTGHAQCSRGGRGGPATSTGGPVSVANAGRGTPFRTNANRLFTGSQRAGLSQQQFDELQQMARLAQQPEVFDVRRSDRAVAREQQIAARRQRMRRQNAEKALLVAQRAEMNGQLARAQRYYRRVVRIVGASDDLGAFATNSNNEIAQRKASATTPIVELASASIR